MDAPQAASRRPCFIEEDDGLASLANMEAGFSCETLSPRRVFPFLFSRPLCYARSGSFRNLGSFVDSPRSVRVFDPRFEDPRPHFLEACFGCKKPLGNNKDIFMYRGDTPFCSEECRQEQIEIDEAKERNVNLTSMRKKEQKMSSSPPTAQDYTSHTGTVAAA